MYKLICSLKVLVFWKTSREFEYPAQMVNHWDIKKKSVKGSSYVAFLAAGQLPIRIVD